MNGREVKECAGLAHPPTTAPVQVVVAQFVIRSAKAGGGGYECKVGERCRSGMGFVSVAMVGANGVCRECNVRMS